MTDDRDYEEQIAWGLEDSYLYMRTYHFFDDLYGHSDSEERDAAVKEAVMAYKIEKTDNEALHEMVDDLIAPYL